MKQEELTKMSSHRKDGVPYPDEAPTGWVHLTSAISIFGQTLLRGDWEYPYFEWSKYDPSKISDIEQTEILKDNFAYWNKCKDRVAREFLWLCKTGHIVTGYRPIGGGAIVQPMQPEHWEIENIYLRFETWSFDPADPASNEISLPNWIWVQQPSLQESCDRISKSLSNIGTLVCFEEGQICSVTDALKLLNHYADFSDEQSVVGFPKGALTLADYLGSGAVGCVAGRMERRQNANRRGEGGVLVDSRSLWEVPAELWDSLKKSPVQKWLAGSFVMPVDDSNTILLDDVSIDRWQLLEAMEQQGLLIRVQERINSDDATIREGWIAPPKSNQKAAAAIADQPVFKGRFKEILTKAHREFQAPGNSKALNNILSGYYDEAAPLCKSANFDSITSMLRRAYKEDRES